MAHFMNQPMYQKIKEDILHQIKTNLLAPGDRLPTEHELMQHYQVSRITVSKALSELKSEGFIERFPNRGSFVSGRLSAPPLSNEIKLPEESAQNIDLLPEVACIMPTVRDIFSLSMMNGVLSAFPQNEYICHFFQSQNPQMENYLLKRCMETGIAGIILFPRDQPFFSNELLLMNLQKYPLVLLDRYLPRLNTSHVIADNQKAGELCVKHLYGLGHRRIAFVTASDRNTFSIKHRLGGILATAESLNMPESSIRVIERMSINQETISRLVREEKITAFIAAECNTCIYLDELCSSLNLHIPEAVSLISFDLPMSMVRNPDFFTHINQSEQLMGQEAGLLLRKRLEQNDMNVYHKVITPSLDIHHSTASVVL
ncbi:MAG: GntR family transcriptional regulator [Lachnospiraceae bacterium]|nr:GntR family transcriptional regulator [Lachnospiraceae bacterium]